MNRRLFPLITVLLVWTALMSAELPAATAAVAVGEEPEIAIGFSYSGSGAYESGSAGLREGLELWRAHVNAAGGISIGGIQYKVRFVTYDDASDPDRVRNIYERLIRDDEVDLLVAPYSSSLGAAAVAVADRHDAIILTSVVASDDVYTQGYSSVYQVLSPGSAYVKPAVSLLADLRPGARLALLYKDDPFSRSVIDGARGLMADRGLTIVFDRAYPDTTTDFTELTTELAAAKPDALIGGGHLIDGIALTREIAAQQLPIDFLTIMSAPASHEFGTLGAAAAGVIYPSQWESGVSYRPTYGPAPEAFTAAYSDRYGHAPDYHGAGGYTTGLVLQHALETAGSLETHALHVALDHTDVTTLGGRVKFSTDPGSHGLQIGHGMLLVQWQNRPSGRFVKEIVWPSELKTADVVFPMGSSPGAVE